MIGLLIVAFLWFIILITVHAIRQNALRVQANEECQKDESQRHDREHAHEQTRGRQEQHTNDSSTKTEQDYGRVLNLQGQVRAEDVKRRYKELAAQYHPDKVSHLGPKLKELAEAEMKEINEAYDYFRRKYEIT